MACGLPVDPWRSAKAHRVDWSRKPEKWFGAGLVRKPIFMLAVMIFMLAVIKREHRYGLIAHMDRVTDFYSVDRWFKSSRNRRQNIGENLNQ